MGNHFLRLSTYPCNKKCILSENILKWVVPCTHQGNSQYGSILLSQNHFNFTIQFTYHFLWILQSIFKIAISKSQQVQLEPVSPLVFSFVWSYEAVLWTDIWFGFSLLKEIHFEPQNICHQSANIVCAWHSGNVSCEMAVTSFVLWLEKVFISLYGFIEHQAHLNNCTVI